MPGSGGTVTSTSGDTSTSSSAVTSGDAVTSGAPGTAGAAPMAGAAVPPGAAPGGTGSPNAILRRLLTPKPAPKMGERCEMCGEMLAEKHGHVVHLENRALMCACRPCSLLFTNKGAGSGRYRMVPERVLHDPDFAFTDVQWGELQIPVRMAFFFNNSDAERVVAFYPSPAGATESELSLDSWDSTLGASPIARELEPDVEALLIWRIGDTYDCLLVPIDSCYHLVGLVRLHWKGFDGGTEAWEHIEAYFATLRDRSAPLPPRADDPAPPAGPADGG